MAKSNPQKLRCVTCGRKHRRSHPQNARYWMLLHEISDGVRPQGQSYSAEVWHHYMKLRYLGGDDVRLPNGKVITVPRSTAALDIGGFNEFMAAVEHWAGERDVWLDSLDAA